MNPKDLKFKMPPEWFPHARSFLSWPVKESMCWPENYLEVCRGYAEVAKAAARFEPVTVLINPDNEEEAAAMCGPEVELMKIEHNDSWIRDNGPTFVVNEKGEAAGINWRFNAWGGKYAPWDLDDNVPPALLGKLGYPCFNAPLVMEGGSIHVDGEGTLLTTEECLLNPNRNPDLGRDEIEGLLKKYIGIEKVIWLKRGLYGDETDGHVDNIACFGKPGLVIIQTCANPEDPNYDITRENLEILKESVDARGRKLKVVEIPQPPASYHDGKRLTLSYLNFYFVNRGIILPVFGGECHDADQEAERILQKIFPDRVIVPVDGMLLIKEGGNVHCITQQMPKGRPAVLSKEGK